MISTINMETELWPTTRIRELILCYAEFNKRIAIKFMNYFYRTVFLY